MECHTLAMSGHLSTRLQLGDNLRLLVRIWLKIRREGVHKEERDGDMVKTWDTLVDHKKELLAVNKSGLDAQYNELGTVLKKVDMPSKEMFVSIYGKILVNAFSLRSDR